VGKFNPPLPAFYFKEETESLPLIEVSIPALVGPDQDKTRGRSTQNQKNFFHQRKLPPKS